MKKQILLFLLTPVFAFGQVTTFEEINKINGIQEFQRTVIAGLSRSFS